MNVGWGKTLKLTTKAIFFGMATLTARAKDTGEPEGTQASLVASLHFSPVKF